MGAESYAARLTLEAKKDVTVGKSEMMSSLDKLIRIIGILLIPIGAALFVKEFVFLESAPPRRRWCPWWPPSSA